MEYYYGEQLTQYAEKGDLEGIRVLLEKHQEFDEERIEEAMKTALFAASRKGHTGIVKMLIDYGANVVSTDELEVILCC
ncbi:unnamed protein product [Enterobius vermicularis]|uniref:ANK_REP_REGION domain-containing protein n=1 Tax=Enterobius vermicularis TaxID=51028 RepID=A0A0N4VHG2_ENTVE|nr:unnamed protein product [Enterobius vermicularis]